MKIDVETPDSEQVNKWRREQLLQAGCADQLARLVAGDHRFDLHQLIELVERGCRPDLAVRILAPLDDPPPAA